MRIAIFGATSVIAKDLIEIFSTKTDYECTLFVRSHIVMDDWIFKFNINKNYNVQNYSEFDLKCHYDVIINFVGVGDPAQAKVMGSSIFDVTYKYDMMILDYLQYNQTTKYIFLSSGAVYGGDFKDPVTKETLATVDVNNFKETDWYAIAKLYAEARHRAASKFSIVDIRIFNYFSHTQNIQSRFLITDIVRALMNNEVFITSQDNIVRDFITPPDFFRLIQAVINSTSVNIAIDAYTKSPIEKIQLLTRLSAKFGLQYELTKLNDVVNATGAKLNYFSLSRMSEKIDYEPQNTSLDGIINEISLLQNFR